jgi:Fic family protein
MLTWTEAVTAAVRRVAARSHDGTFSRQELIASEGATMSADTGTSGDTPMQTVSRVLQELRDEGVIKFLDDRGTYQLID